MASFSHRAYTFTSGSSSKTVYLKWIKTNHRDIRIVYTGWKNVYAYTSSTQANNRLYGINGTFYEGYNGSSLMISMYHSNPGVSNAEKVWSTGDRNSDSFPKETLICLNQTSSSIPQFIFSDSVTGALTDYRYNGTTAFDLKNVRWAVSGFSLKLNESISKSDYDYFLEHMVNEGGSPRSIPTMIVTSM